MPGLFSIAYADLASRRLTTALTVIAVMLGTAVVVAAFTTNVAVEDSMRESAAATVGDAHLIVEALDDKGFASSSVAAVQRLDGVQVVAPQVHRRVFYRAAGQRGFAEVIGIDPAFDPLVRPYTFSSGRQLTAADARAALVGTAWAGARGIRVGDSVELVTTEGVRPFQVVGLVDEADPSQRGSTAIVRIPLSTAQSAFGAKERVHSLSIVLSDPAKTDDVKASLEAALPYVFTVRERGQVLEDLLASVRDFEAALAFFGAIALLAGAVLVFNTLSLTVVERTQEIGLLRAVGASTGRVVRLMLAQGLLIGVAGAVLGAILGQVLAVALVLIIGRTQGIPVAGLPVSALGIGAGIALGISVTLVATALPAIRAGRTSPLAAMTATHTFAPRPGSAWRRRIADLAATAILVFLFLPIPGDAARAAKAVALIVLVPLFISLSRSLVPAVAAVAALVVRRLGRGIGVLAERTVNRERGQTTLTVASFVLGLGLIVALANGSAAFTNAGQESAQALFPGEMVVVSPVDQPIELITEFDALPGVDQVSPVTWQPVTWQGVRLTAAGVDPAHYFQAFQFTKGERTDAYRAMRRGEGVLITAALAKGMELAVGDPMRLTVGDVPGEFTVAGVIAHSLPTNDGFGAVVLPRDAMERIYGVSSFRFLAVTAAPGTDLGALARELSSAAESFGMEARTQDDLARSIGSGVGALFALLGGLVAIGVVVGALGLVNTMVLNIAQRAREVGIMRAVGMARPQVRGLAIAEAALLGSLGAVLGVLLGALLTWALVDLTRTADVDARFTFSIPVALAVIAAGLAIAIAASLYPAARASRMDILAALRER